MVFEGLVVAIRVFVRQIGAERMRIFPASHDGVVLVHDRSRGVQVIGVDVIHLDRAGGGGLLEHGDRNAFEPHGFLTDRPVVRLRGGGIVLIFADRLTVLVIKIPVFVRQRPGFADAFAQCIVAIVVRFSVSGGAGQIAGSIPNECCGAIAQRIAGGIKTVALGDRPGNAHQAVAGGCNRIRISRTAKLRLGAVTVGVITP